MKRLVCLAAFSLFMGLFPYGSCRASTLKFQPIVTLSTGAITPQAFAIGDFNGDGKPDLAVPDFNGKTVSAYLNQGGGDFSTAFATTLPIASTLDAIVSGDFNSDGKADLAVSNFAPNQVLTVLLSNGDGTFAVQPPIAASFGFESGTVADFKGDNHLDLFLGGNGSAEFFLGLGDGTFSQGSIAQSPHQATLYLGVAAGDFNGDKKMDGIAANYGPQGVGSVDLYFGDGSGSLGSTESFPPPTPTPNPRSIAVADINGDGKLDLLVSGNGSAIAILGNGDGTFQLADSQLVTLLESPYPPNVTDPDQVIVLAADMDLDGHPDAVVLDSTTGLLAIALNDGTGTFSNATTTPYTYQFPAGSYMTATADFNGDGLPDIASSYSTGKTISLLLSGKRLSKPTVELTSSGSNVLVGTPVTFKTAITGGAVTATGTVSLMDGSSQIAQQTLDASASAVFNVSDLTVGVHTLTMTYSGDTNYTSGTSAALSQSVTDFQVALKTASQTVTAGTTASYPLTVSPQAGFTGNVAFSCSGLPSLATLTAAVLTVGATPGTETVMISTAASTTAQTRRPGGISYACMLLGCLSLWGFAKSNGRSAKRFLMLLPIFCVLGLGPLACGGGSKQTIPGTPSGTSNITITATTTQNGVTVTHNATATLIVQ